MDLKRTSLSPMLMKAPFIGIHPLVKSPEIVPCCFILGRWDLCVDGGQTHPGGVTSISALFGSCQPRENSPKGVPTGPGLNTMAFLPPMGKRTLIGLLLPWSVNAMPVLQAIDDGPGIGFQRHVPIPWVVPNDRSLSMHGSVKKRTRPCAGFTRIRKLIPGLGIGDGIR